MRIYTSYFYQIRNFPKTLVPLSTAMWDPKWYHRSQGENYLFIDNRGVLNGMRVPELAPGPNCSGLCSGKEHCMINNSKECDFLRNYREQLNNLDFKEFINSLYSLSDALKEIHDLPEVNFALIVHEDPSNPCSERSVIQEWFKDNNYDITEFSCKSS